MARQAARAWTWQGTADPLALRLDEVVLASPGPRDVLVANHSIALNPVDWKVLSGLLPRWAMGHIPGVDGAGIVLAAGPATSIAPGTRVAYHADLQRHGSFASHSVVTGQALLRLPESMSFTTAASVPCPHITAWQEYLEHKPLGLRLPRRVVILWIKAR